jgi:CBS domain-containing membrane protein
MTSLRVRNLMSSHVHTVREADSLESVYDLMNEHDVRHVPVTDGDGDLVGLISHRDLLRKAMIEQEGFTLSMERDLLESTTAGEVMTSTVATTEADETLSSAAQLMAENKFGCLPVVEGQRLVGILTESDFVRFHASGDGAANPRTAP